MTGVQGSDGASSPVSEESGAPGFFLLGSALDSVIPDWRNSGESLPLEVQRLLTGGPGFIAEEVGIILGVDDTFVGRKEHGEAIQEMVYRELARETIGVALPGREVTALGASSPTRMTLENVDVFVDYGLSSSGGLILDPVPTLMGEPVTKICGPDLSDFLLTLLKAIAAGRYSDVQLVKEVSPGGGFDYKLMADQIISDCDCPKYCNGCITLCDKCVTMDVLGNFLLGFIASQLGSELDFRDLVLKLAFGISAVGAARDAEQGRPETNEPQDQNAISGGADMEYATTSFLYGLVQSGFTRENLCKILNEKDLSGCDCIPCDCPGYLPVPR